MMFMHCLCACVCVCVLQHTHAVIPVTRRNGDQDMLASAAAAATIPPPHATPQAGGQIYSMGGFTRGFTWLIESSLLGAAL